MVENLKKILELCVDHIWFGIFLFFSCIAVGSLIIDLIRAAFGIYECQ